MQYRCLLCFLNSERQGVDYFTLDQHHFTFGAAKWSCGWNKGAISIDFARTDHHHPFNYEKRHLTPGLEMFLLENGACLCLNWHSLGDELAIEPDSRSSASYHVETASRGMDGGGATRMVLVYLQHY